MPHLKSNTRILPEIKDQRSQMHTKQSCDKPYWKLLAYNEVVGCWWTSKKLKIEKAIIAMTEVWVKETDQIDLVTCTFPDETPSQVGARMRQKLNTADTKTHFDIHLLHRSFMLLFSTAAIDAALMSFFLCL